MTANDAATWAAHLARYPNRPAPKETYEQYLRGEISLEDYLWLTGGKASETKKARVSSSYLVSAKKGSAAHHWDGSDTLCRMFSTGGMSKRRYRETADLGGSKLCAMCAAKAR